VKPEPAKQEPAKQEPATPEPGPGDKLEKFLKNPPPPSKEPSTTRPEQMAAASGAGPRPLPASANASGNRSLTRALGLKLARVVIDAGHGGHDEGTRGPTGLLEKDLVLDVALRLGTLVEQRLGAEVVYTRSTDVFVPLEERTAIANRLGADLFLSIHANSSPIKSISGSEVYFLSFATSKEALDLAGRENAGTNRSIHELQDLLKKIALNEKVTESQEFGARVQRELYTAWNRMSGVSRNRGVKKAPFVVLIGAQMPSVLAEIGFVSNPRDEGLLKRADQRQRLAEALYRGVNAYASTLSHMEAAPKPASRAAR
jgi:N-acetylmuramoyl-L-alanine amidase